MPNFNLGDRVELINHRYAGAQGVIIWVSSFPGNQYSEYLVRSTSAKYNGCKFFLQPSQLKEAAPDISYHGKNPIEIKILQMAERRKELGYEW